jgi:RimJ/RimL family protein N-acetyltransferase
MGGKMEFKVLTLDDCLEVAKWRNETLYALRTPYGLTEEQQREFYKNVVCDRKANARYWAIMAERDVDIKTVFGTYIKTIKKKGLIGMAGIENIEWENRRAEISLILNPSERSKGNGDNVFEIILYKGFYELNLENIWGVCYECNPALVFWERQINKYKGKAFSFPNMKYQAGKYWRGLYFNFERSEYVANNT